MNNIDHKINKYTFLYGGEMDEYKKQIYKHHLDHYKNIKKGGAMTQPVIQPMTQPADITNKNIVFFGCGGVAKAMFCYMNKFFKFDPKKVTIVDFNDYRNHPSVSNILKLGATYHISDLRKTYKKYLEQLNPYDFVIDLTSQTQSLEFIKECKSKNLHYINTSIEYSEELDFENDIETKGEIEESSYLKSHKDALDINNKFIDNKATILLTFGFNPGMVSIMIKKGIMFMAENHSKKDKIKEFIDRKNWSELTKFLGIEVIHCSETDSTEYLDLKDDKPDVFVNTWCVYSFLQEGVIDKCEFAYGKKQTVIPADSIMLSDKIISMKKSAMHYWGESYVPGDGKIVGIIIPHSESISGPEYFGDGTYWPTMHYVYRWSPVVNRAIKRMENKQKFNRTHIINNAEDKFRGVDRVGALLLTKDKAVWVGSILDNMTHECNTMNGTLVQVAVSVLSAMRWMVANPERSIIFPEALDEEYVLNLAKPYLGEFYCDFVNYNPPSLQFGDLLRTREDFDKQFTSSKT